MFKKTAVARWLEKAPAVAFIVVTILAAFCTYSCMYAFRKPFAVATFEGLSYWGIDYKILLITAQVLGYTLSKFIGIKVVSEMSGERRAFSILILIGLAGVALALFALIPSPYNIIMLFFNGIPLGMVWGLVFSYLEGRRFTEVLGAGLSVSFIFSSGFVKTVGKWTMVSLGVSEYWMPVVTGLFFVVPLLFFVWLLDQVPPPSAEDIKLRTKRAPMSGPDRIALVKKFAPGLVVLTLSYILLTAFRDFRDNFAAEIWDSLGYGDSSSIFTITEIPISIGVLVILGSVLFIKSNYRALVINHLLIFLGFFIVGTSTLAFENNWLNAPIWMTLVGFGLYMGYVPFNSIFFDRLIATFRYVSNVGFLIYLADSFGYLGSVGVLLYKNFGQSDISWLEFFTSSSYLIAILGMLLMALSMGYFQWKYKRYTSEEVVGQSVKNTGLAID